MLARTSSRDSAGGTASAEAEDATSATAGQGAIGPPAASAPGTSPSPDEPFLARSRGVPGRRGILLALVAGALLAIAGPDLATAAPVGSERVAGGAADFWTPERLERAEAVDPPEPADARPAPAAARAAASERGRVATVEPAAPGSASPFRIRQGRRDRASSLRPSSPDQLGFGDFASGKVADPAAPGVRMHGRVFFKVPGAGTGSCSGTAITSNRKNLVLTAGHCVHGGGYQSPWFKKWVFVPGYENGAEPFGVWEAKRLYSTGLWTEFGIPNADFAVATMRRLNGKRIQEVVGARGITFNRKPDQRFAAYGYPAEDPFDGETEHYCKAQIAGLDENTEDLSGPATVGIGCDMTGGSSGGSWVLNDRYAASLTSYGYDELPDFLFGPQFTEVARDLYQAAQASCRGKVATHVGTNAKDRIVGTKGRDVIVGGDGGDVIAGKRGNDLICGGGGPDKLKGDAGKDALIGQSGGDRLKGGRGKDVCKGGGGKNRGTGCESKSRLR